MQNDSITVFVRLVVLPSLTLMIVASVTPWGFSSLMISSTLHAATSRERITPLQVLSER